MAPCEFSQIFKNNYFVENLRTAVSMLLFLEWPNPKICDLLEPKTGNFYSFNITMAPPSNVQNLVENSNTEEKTDCDYLSSDQLNTQREFHINYGMQTIDGLERKTFSDELDPWKQRRIQNPVKHLRKSTFRK